MIEITLSILRAYVAATPLFNCTYKYEVCYFIHRINYLCYNTPLAYHCSLNIHVLLSTKRFVLLVLQYSPGLLLQPYHTYFAKYKDLYC